ncbi:MAG: DUF3267 domain-containing protein [Chloroflexota bacterium]
MQPTRNLPPTYHPIWSMRLKDSRLVLALNLLALGLFFPCGICFLVYALAVRPDLEINGQFDNLSLVWLLAIIGTFAVTIILHELVHGLFYWIVTRERPTFGLTWLYAYAVAPGWYFPRNPFIAIGLAPLVVITALGLLAILFVPAKWLPLVLLALLTNATGAVADVFVVGRLLFMAPEVIIEDRRDGITVFRQVTE